MVGQSQHQRKKVERGVRSTVGGKYRAASNVQVVHAMYLHVGIDDALPWVLVHARGSHVMISPIHHAHPFGPRIVQEPDHAGSRGKQLPPESSESFPVAGKIVVRNSHVESEPRHTERIPVGGK